MRKFFVFLSVAMIVACCALPASAAEVEPQAQEDFVYAPVTFDTISFGATGQAFPLNAFHTNDLDRSFNFDLGYESLWGVAWGQSFGGLYGLDSQFIVPGDITLSASNQYIQPNFLANCDYVIEVFSRDPNRDVVIDNITISFTVVQFMYNNETMVLEPEFKPYSITFEDWGRNDFELNYYLSNLIKTQVPTFNDNKPVVNVQDLSISFDFSNNGSALYEIQLKWLGSNTPSSNDASIFYYEYGPFYTAVGSPENQATLMSFFTDTIGGFMNFELFPGLSFGFIFYIVLVIGIVLWLVTILI